MRPCSIPPTTTNLQAVKTDVTEQAASLIRLIDAIDGPQQQQFGGGGFGGRGGQGQGPAGKGYAATYIIELFRGAISSRNRQQVRREF